jgi:hypothetical protein
MEPEAFYDDLALDYHLIFADWEASIARQAEALAPLLGAAETVLDAACGIGTQALGLARAGFAVTASASLHGSQVPGGVLLASTRDYDAAPTGDPPRRFADRTVEQIWEWEDDECYVLRHRIVRDGRVAERRTRYRALRRATLTAALHAAGFADVAWPATAFPQPVVSARTSSRATATSRTRR